MQIINDEVVDLRFDFDPGSVDKKKPLIYLLEIVDLEGVVRYRYVGKASGGAERPLRHYPRNVRNYLLGKPYRKGKPTEFRAVHIRLADAVRWGWLVRLYLLCNIAEGQDINAVEQGCHLQYALDTIGGRQAA
jgi:hypothetical protein